MKDFEALKNIWHDQVALPKVSHEDVLKKVRKTKQGLAAKLLREMLGMVAATIGLIYVWINNPFKLWTTHLAMIIFIACCLYYIFVLIRDYRKISDNTLLLNKPEEYINYLKKYKHDRYIFNTRKYRIYSLFFSLGFVLYFIEVSFLASLWVTILGITFTVAWLLFSYFILMRNYIRKEEAKLEDMIENLERLHKQFENTDQEE